MVHTRRSGHDDQRELEVSRKLVLRRAKRRTALSPPMLDCRESLRLMVLFRRRCPWPYAQFIAQMSMLRKSCNFSQDNLTHHFSLVLLKYQKHVWSQPMRAAGWNFCISNPVHTDGRKKERKMLKDQWTRAAGLNCSIFQASWSQRTRRMSSLTG